MSNLIFNLRIGLWHFQIRRDWPFVAIQRNDYHEGKLGKSSPWIAFY